MAPIVEGSSSKARIVINSPTSTSSSWAIGEPTPPSQSPANQKVEQVTLKFEEVSVKEHVKIGKRGNEGIHQANDSAWKSKEVDPTDPPETKYAMIKDGEITEENGDGDENETPIIRRDACNYSSEPVQFLVGESENVVYVHRNLLSCAPVLEALYLEAQGRPVRVPEYRLCAFTNLVRWLYTDYSCTYTHLSSEELGLLYDMAIKYNIGPMKLHVLAQFYGAIDFGYGYNMISELGNLYEALIDPKDPLRTFFQQNLRVTYNCVPQSKYVDGVNPIKTLLLKYADYGGWLAADILEVFVDIESGTHATRLGQDQDYDNLCQWYREADEEADEVDQGLTGPGPAFVEDGDEDEDEVGETMHWREVAAGPGWSAAPKNTGDSWAGDDQKHTNNACYSGWNDAKEDSANYDDDEVAYGNGKRKAEGISAEKHTAEKLTEWEDQAESSRRAYISTGKGDHLNRARNADMQPCDSLQHHPCVAQWNGYNKGQPLCVLAPGILPTWVQQGPFSQGRPAAFSFCRPETATGFTPNNVYPSARYPVCQPPAAPKEDCITPKGGW